jgi:hypothetical protein
VLEEDALDADVRADLADGEGAAGTRPVALDHDALEDLDALLVALDDLVVHPDRIADAKLGDIAAQLRLLDGRNRCVDHGLLRTGSGEPTRGEDFVNHLLGVLRGPAVGFLVTARNEARSSGCPSPGSSRRPRR